MSNCCVIYCRNTTFKKLPANPHPLRYATTEPRRSYRISFALERFKLINLPVHKSLSPTHHSTATMGIPIATITTFRTAYNPFSRAARPCRLFLGMLRTPDTIPTSSPTHIDIKVKQLPRNSTESPTMTIGFKGGKELTLDVGKRGLKIGDVIEEVSRVGRALQREASLKN